MSWLVDQGATVFVPIGHSPDIDLVAYMDGHLVTVQVKTSNCLRNGRFSVTLATRGGNQSWSGLVKRFDPRRCDYLFAHVGDGRRWFIPARAVEGGSGLLLGGPKYEAYEVEPGRPLEALAEARNARLADPGGVPERSKGPDCKSGGSAFAGSNPAPAIVGPLGPWEADRAPDGPRSPACAGDSAGLALGCAGHVELGDRSRGPADPGPQVTNLSHGHNVTQDLAWPSSCLDWRKVALSRGLAPRWRRRGHRGAPGSLRGGR
jgi:hypothetical protein